MGIVATPVRTSVPVAVWAAPWTTATAIRTRCRGRRSPQTPAARTIAASATCRAASTSPSAIAESDTCRTAKTSATSETPSPSPEIVELHTGHALQLALEDALCRWHRMRGHNVLFQPGYDHAGISTQAVVEKDLENEGLTRNDLGREAFEARVWEWLHLYGRTIMAQFRRMGASLDYRRERFTMDEDYIRAVM